MDKLTIKNITKLNNVLDRYIKLNKSFNGNFKKKLILFDNFSCKLKEIEEILDDFEIKNESDIELDIDFEKRIKNNKENKKLMELLSPYLVFYILNKLYSI